MDSSEKLFKQWEAERTSLYDSLDTVISDLHKFHIESSKYVCAGNGTKAAGTLITALGAIGGYEKTEVGGHFLEAVGSATVAFTQLAQEYKDCKALAESEQLLDDHRNTHKDLKTALLEIHCVLPSLDYRQIYCTPDVVKVRNNISDPMQKALGFYNAIHPRKAKETPGNNGDKASDVDNMVDARGKQDQKKEYAKEEIFSNIDGVKTIINAISGIIKRDVPLFFQSLQTMYGNRVPETVKRLRCLKNDLERQQDQLFIQLENLFNGKEFQRALKTA